MLYCKYIDEMYNLTLPHTIIFYIMIKLINNIPVRLGRRSTEHIQRGIPRRKENFLPGLLLPGLLVAFLSLYIQFAMLDPFRYSEL